MARNDQVTRQWHLLRRLESPRGATLHELAEGLPDDFPKHLRTLRRDLAALEASGFPLVTDRVDGQTRWRLLEGFHRVPALTFSPTELMALVFSRDLLKPLEGTQIRAALDSALTKVTAALPPSGVSFVRQMQDFLSVRLGPHKTYRQRVVPTLGVDRRRRAAPSASRRCPHARGGGPRRTEEDRGEDKRGEETLSHACEGGQTPMAKLFP